MELNCTECGLCCVAHTSSEGYCALTEGEVTQYDPSLVHLPTKKEVREASLAGEYMPAGFLRTKPAAPWGRVCCMLEGTVLVSVRCRIYSMRPTACRRAAEPGDEGCRRLRRAAGLVDD